jgi:hypothetical protein
MRSIKTIARIGGILYLINIVLGIFSIGYVPSIIVVSGDIQATAQNILVHEIFYRVGFVAHIIILLTNIPLAVIFYNLFKVVNRKASLLVVFFTLVGTAIEAVNLLNQFAPLIFLRSTHYQGVFSAEQLQSFAYMSFQFQAIGINLALIFFGFYCISIGYLIFKSTFLPRIVGILMSIGGLSYLLNSFANFLAPEFAAGLVPYIQIPSGLAELTLCLWFLIKGIDVTRWEEKAKVAN